MFRETKVSSTESVLIEIDEIYAYDYYEWSQTDCEGTNYYGQLTEHDFESCKQFCREIGIRYLSLEFQTIVKVISDFSVEHKVCYILFSIPSKVSDCGAALVAWWSSGYAGCFLKHAHHDCKPYIFNRPSQPHMSAQVVNQQEVFD